MDKRWIFHCDCNSFFASVELLDHPELRDVPVAVSGSADARHGIILAKNEAAKKFHIQTAETIWQAKQKCPDLTLLPPHRERYSFYYKRINAIYQQYSDLVEPFSIDESWLDVTGSWQLFAPDPITLANNIREEVKAKTGLTISVGVSWNKIYAKLGSDYKKPDATTVFLRQNYQKLIYPLPVTDLIYVGDRVAKTLHSLGITTIGQLAGADLEMLTGALGKMGPQLYKAARGEDTSPVRPVGEHEPPKSVGNGLTFKKNLTTEAEIRAGLTALSDEVAGRLRRYKLWASGVQVTIKDVNLHSIQRQCRLPHSTHLEKELTTAAWQLVKQHWPQGKPIRMLTVTAVNLTDMPMAVQQSFFEPASAPDPKREKLEASLDVIRQKYGRTSIAPAAAVNPALGLEGLHIAAEQSTSEEDAPVKGPLRDTH